MSAFYFCVNSRFPYSLDPWQNETSNDVLGITNRYFSLQNYSKISHEGNWEPQYNETSLQRQNTSVLQVPSGGSSSVLLSYHCTLPCKHLSGYYNKQTDQLLLWKFNPRSRKGFFFFLVGISGFLRSDLLEFEDKKTAREHDDVKSKNKTFGAKVIWNKLRHKINGSSVTIKTRSCLTVKLVQEGLR